MILRGSGEDGQLGIGNNEEKEWVCVVKALDSHSVRSVVAGSRNSLAICDDGKVPSSLCSKIFYSRLLLLLLINLVVFSLLQLLLLVLILFCFIWVGWLVAW